ncbi:TPA: hypothetical protein ACHFQP_001692 [Escherichia coli]
MKVTANGKTFTFPDGTSTEDIGAAIDEYFAGQAVQQQTVNQANNAPTREEPSLMQQAGDWLTGGQSAGQIAEQAGRGLVNIPFDVLQGGASLINAISQGLGGPKVLDDVYRPVDRPTDPYAQTGETIGGYLVPGVGVLTRANRLGKVANKDLIRGLSDLREELAKPDVDFGLLRELRSALRESIQGDAMVFPNSAKAATDAVERAMGSDLRNNAARYLGAGEAARYVKANSDYSNVFNKVLNKRIANNLNKAKKEFTPELINSVVFSRKPSDIKRIWPALSEDGKNAMRAAYISKIAEKAGDSPTKFLTELNKLKSQSDGQIYNTIFSGRHMKELDALHEVLQQTARSDIANVVTQTGQSQANRIRTIGATATLGATLALESGFGTMMRLYESKATRNALLRLANTKAGTPAYERALNNAANAIRPLFATEATQQ